MLKQQIQNSLAFLARHIITKYHPKVIGITGSVGKTSAKEAIYHVVSQRYRTRRPLKNFNNEFGLPLTIIGSNSPGRNVFGWLVVLAKGAGLLLFGQRFPEVLVLEMGIDRVGDMEHLTSIARPDIAVITSIGTSHYEFFRDLETLEQEKGKLAEALTEQGVLVVNGDICRAPAGQWM